MKIIITESQLDYILNEAGAVCPSGKKEDSLITLDDVKKGKTIKKGYCNFNTNSAIVKVQELLRKKKYLTFSGKLGYYGGQTQEAIKKFYKDRQNKEVYGTEIGPNTVKLLQGNVAKVATPSTKGKITDLIKNSIIKLIYGVDPRLVIAATLIGEAGGESEQPKAMKAIYDVLENRAGNSDYYDIASEALKKLQFSCWNGVSRNKSGIEDYIKEKKKHSRWASAMKIVNDKDSGNVTKGATHYYAYAGTNALKPSDMPDWIKSMKETVRIGNHKFGIA